MSVATAKLMTEEEFLAFPDDGVERWLIKGSLREGSRLGYHDRFHARLTVTIGTAILNWADRQSLPHGDCCVHAGSRLRINPRTIVCIDVAYFSSDIALRSKDEEVLYAGPPILAVEILSSEDDLDYIVEKVEEYLANGVKFVWVVEPQGKTFTVYTPDNEQLFTVRDTISCEPDMPGFVTPVAEFFR